MSAFVLLSVPSKESEIKRIAQNAIVNVALGDYLSGFGADDLAQLGKGAIAVRVEFKNALYDFGVFGMHFDIALKLIIAISERGAARIDTLRGFLLHAFFDFFAKVFDVVTGDEKLKAMHQFGLRLGILIKDLAFFGQVDFYPQIFEGDRISEVAIETIGLFDNHHAAAGILLKKADHFFKLLPAGVLGGFHVYKFADDLDSSLEAIILVEFDLRWNRISFAFLLAAGNPSVKHCLLGGGHGGHSPF